MGAFLFFYLFHFRARWGTLPYVALHFIRSFSSILPLLLQSNLPFHPYNPPVPLRELLGDASSVVTSEALARAGAFLRTRRLAWFLRVLVCAS